MDCDLSIFKMMDYSCTSSLFYYKKKSLNTFWGKILSQDNNRNVSEWVFISIITILLFTIVLSYLKILFPPDVCIILLVEQNKHCNNLGSGLLYRCYPHYFQNFCKPISRLVEKICRLIHNENHWLRFCTKWLSS